MPRCTSETEVAWRFIMHRLCLMAGLRSVLERSTNPFNGDGGALPFWDMIKKNNPPFIGTVILYTISAVDTGHSSGGEARTYSLQQKRQIERIWSTDSEKDEWIWMDVVRFYSFIRLHIFDKVLSIRTLLYQTINIKGVGCKFSPFNILQFDGLTIQKPATVTQ